MENPQGQRRKHQLSPSREGDQPDSKQLKQASVLPPPPPGADQDIIPYPVLIIPVVGELTDPVVKALCDWKQAHPDSMVRLYLDPDTVLAGELHKSIIKQLNLKRESEQFAGLKLKDDDFYRYQIGKDRRAAFEDIKKETQTSGKSWDEAIKVWLLKHKLVGRGQFKKINDTQTAMRQCCDDVGIEVCEKSSTPGNRGFDDLFYQTVFQWGSLRDAENIWRDKLLYENGGVSVQVLALAALPDLHHLSLPSAGDTARVCLGGLEGTAPFKPVSLAAQPGSPVLRQKMDDYRDICKFITDAEKTLEQSIKIKKGQLEAWQSYAIGQQGSQSEPQNQVYERERDELWSELKKNIRKYYVKHYDGHSTSLVQFPHYCHAIAHQYLCGVCWGDANEVLTGIPAYIRNYYASVGATHPTPLPSLDGFNLLKVEIDSLVGRVSFYPPQDEVTTLSEPPHPVMIVQLDNDGTNFRFSEALYRRYVQRNLAAKQAKQLVGVESNLSWWIAEPDPEGDWDLPLLKLYRGQQLTADESTEIILVGHSSRDESFYIGQKDPLDFIMLVGLLQKQHDQHNCILSRGAPYRELSISVVACEICKPITRPGCYVVKDHKDFFRRSFCLGLFEVLSSDGAQLKQVVGRTGKVNIGMDGRIFTYHQEGRANPLSGCIVPYLQYKEPCTVQVFQQGHDGKSVICIVEEGVRVEKGDPEFENYVDELTCPNEIVPDTEDLSAHHDAILTDPLVAGLDIPWSALVPTVYHPTGLPLEKEAVIQTASLGGGSTHTVVAVLLIVMVFGAIRQAISLWFFK